MMLERSIPNNQSATPNSFSCEPASAHEPTSLSPQVLRDPIAMGEPHCDSLEQSASDTPFIIPPKEIVIESFSLYLQYCHKQPLWLFDEEDLSNPQGSCQELMFGILALALRYSDNPFFEGQRDKMCREYAEAARGLVMLRIAQGKCAANDTHMAWLHIGLATSLSKCGGLDIESHHGELSDTIETQRKLFWSIHLLNQQYGPGNMQLSLLHEIQHPKYMGVNMDTMSRMGVKPPQPPQETGNARQTEGIWIYMVQLSTLWSEVQHYVSHCASGDSTPPWSLKSGYSAIGAHLMNIETKFPTSHRWDSVRFMDHSKEDLHQNRGYWSPWLYLQFTYHAIHSVLNHPFLYSWRPQQSSQLAVPNTFWKTSSELALIHTTWTVRLIEIIKEKHYQVSDPSIGHLVAIAATIQLYYCCAADPAIRDSAQTKVDICLRFLGQLAKKWPRCQAIHQKLELILQSAFASNTALRRLNSPRRKLSINTALMWDILLYNSPRTSSAHIGEGLFDISFFQAPENRMEDKETVETEFFHHSTRTIDTSDGGQGLPPYSSAVNGRSSSRDEQQSEQGLWNRSLSSPPDNINEQLLPQETMISSGSGFRGDVSWMDLSHDPFFQFQDNLNPNLGIWEVGNL
ncbi:uncharacterized protein N7479_009997 [Penicillium vulpinum]|uniref:uncharacterized protein n=1 Tax=Penicillium vulpinum TaxID=29845 RepID=UPI0025498001|nr:uncharacterized protein N7479_009997 [Penicillium vulpinum]KAJ5951584.1 hypothetical protein N7479_009997 [Penicillium vulpinum]